MSLNTKQTLFTKTQAYFQVWCFENGYDIIEAESHRPRFVAEYYAARGIGIKDSTHTYKLARDIFRVVNGKVTWDVKHYEPLGAKWKTMHPLARWGGDFKGRDAVHFSFEHRGIK